MRWPWRRREEVRSAPALVFDASIDVDVDGRDRDATIADIRERVSSLPGAVWVSVEPHGGAGPEVRLFPAGSSREGVGSAWAELHGRVVAAVREVLAARPKRASGAWPSPAPARQGFAEAMAPSQFDALAELAALVEISRKPKPAPP